MPFVLAEYGHAMGNGPGGLFEYHQLFEKYPSVPGRFHMGVDRPWVPPKGLGWRDVLRLRRRLWGGAPGWQLCV
jgi:beta-galactosidase/beta-glucuronidase